MVTRHVWHLARLHGGHARYLCIPCLEKRIRRELCPADFTDAPVNDPCDWDTPLLAARKGHR